MPNPFEEIKIAEKLIDMAKALTKGDDASAALFEDIGATKAVSAMDHIKVLPKVASEQSVVIDPSMEGITQAVNPFTVSTDISNAQREIIDRIKSLVPLHRSVDRDVRFFSPSQIHAEMTKRRIPRIVEDIP